MNIFILDCSGSELFKDFIKNPSFKVVGAIVFTEEEKSYCLKHQVLEAHTLKEMDFLQEYLESLDFALMEEFRPTQRKVEFGMMRSLNSNMLIANKYYNALAYFHWLFQNFQIDCIFVSGVPHGYIPETILLDMGKKFKIPTYCIFPITSQYSSILRYDQRENIPIATPIQPDLFSQQIFDKKKQSHDSNRLKMAIGKKAFKQLIHMGGGADHDRYSFLFQKKEAHNSYGVL